MILLLWSNNIRPHHLEGLEWNQDFSGWTKASKNPKLLNSWNPLFPKPMTYPMIIAFSIHQTSSNKGLESSTAQPRRGTTCDKQRVGNKKEDCLRQIYNQNDTTLSSLTSTWPIIQPEQYSDPLISQAMMASGGRKRCAANSQQANGRNWNETGSGEFSFTTNHHQIDRGNGQMLRLFYTKPSWKTGEQVNMSILGIIHSELLMRSIRAAPSCWARGNTSHHPHQASAKHMQNCLRRGGQFSQFKKATEIQDPDGMSFK